MAELGSFNLNHIFSLDIEATGSKHRSAPIQLGLVDLQQNVILNFLCKPAWKDRELRKSLQITEALNHISYEMLQKRRPFAAYRQSVIHALMRCRLLCGFLIHNDLRWLYFNRIFVPQEVAVFDVQLCFTRLQSFIYQADGHIYSLKDTSAMLGVADSLVFHDACDDARATMRCFEKLLPLKLPLDLGLVDRKSGEPLFNLQAFKARFPLSLEELDVLRAVIPEAQAWR